MKSFIQFANEINESSLSRIWRHVQNHTAGAISGYRGENSKEQNQSNNRDIKAFLTTKGYSVTAVSGNYIENFGSENQREVKEPSFFVVDIKDSGNLERDLVALGRRFDQDSVLIVPKGGEGAYLFGTSQRSDAYPNYNTKELVGNSRFGKVAGQYLSRIRGRQFAFEQVNPPDTINGIRGWNILADKIEEEIDENI